MPVAALTLATSVLAAIGALTARETYDLPLGDLNGQDGGSRTEAQSAHGRRSRVELRA